MTAPTSTHAQLILPWPPSVNAYWRHWQGRTLISKAGRAYRSLAVAEAQMQRVRMGDAPLLVTITAYRPDERRRDADNLLKAPLDALTHAGVIGDDSQIVRLTIDKRPLDRERPRLEITLEAA
jgi:crossover junction endodeoxyribonuclease RusA